MAKRFTDTDKWKKPWFRGLKPTAKLVWMYICDQCDHAGIWPADYELLSFQIGTKISKTDLIEWFGDKIIFVGDDKSFLPSFFDFQYADSKEGYKAKQSALDILRRLGLVDESGNIVLPNQPNSQASSDSHGSVPQQLPDTQTTLQGVSGDTPSISIGKSKSKKGECEGKNSGATAQDFEQSWKIYPLKVSKSDAKKRFLALIEAKDLDNFHKAVEIEVRYLEKNPWKHPKHFSTFVGVKDKAPWRDCLEPEYGVDTRPPVDLRKPRVLSNLPKPPYHDEVPKEESPDPRETCSMRNKVHELVESITKKRTLGESTG